ncbi:hypothetical protein SAMD00019534_010190, partial [Acytostelium subglobosum LB1]|uniref:hypothetical protein n=1 Tax=Acytostelium subglobosum LB1 TaxID=1410327 RepID=UPI0006449F6E
MSTILEMLRTLEPESLDDMIDLTAKVINSLVRKGDQNKSIHTQFYPPNNKLPLISIRDYIHRLFKYSPCSRECFIMSLIYIDRLMLECGLSLNSYNIHRILITTLVISTKYQDDIFYNNEFYSQVGGINVQEMNQLELELLRLLNFSANCSNDLFIQYSREIDNLFERNEYMSCT